MADFSSLTTALSSAPIVPVITIDRVADARPVAEALGAAGLTALEITLRTPVALEALTAMKTAAPGMIIGAGTIVTPDDASSAVNAGADFLVSPGVSPNLVPALLETGVPALPGTATASEAMARVSEGFDILKLFPAVPVGGLALLKSLNAPLPGIKFMPTGGISAETAPDFLALPNVIAIGGSWMVSKVDIDAGNWSAIEAKAREAARLGAHS